MKRLQALAARMSSEIRGTNPIARRPADIVDNPKTLYPAERNAPSGKKKARGNANLPDQKA